VLKAINTRTMRPNALNYPLQNYRPTKENVELLTPSTPLAANHSSGDVYDEIAPELSYLYTSIFYTRIGEGGKE
jgi:hypothetical protein